MAGYWTKSTPHSNVVSQGSNLVIDISTGATFGDILVGMASTRRSPQASHLDNQGFCSLLHNVISLSGEPLDFITKRTVATGTVCEESPAELLLQPSLPIIDAAGGDSCTYCLHCATAYFSSPLSITENLYCGTTGIDETENSTPISSSILILHLFSDSVSTIRTAVLQSSASLNLNGAIVSTEQINPGTSGSISRNNFHRVCYVMQLQTNDGVQYGKVIEAIDKRTPITNGCGDTNFAAVIILEVSILFRK